MQQDYFLLLLSKRFSGEITRLETAELDEWLSQAPDNADLAAQYQTIWEKSEGLPVRFNLDMDAEYQRLRARLALPAKSGGKVVSLGMRLLRIAAALTLVLAALWGYRQWTTPAAMAVESTGGAEKRLLELSDGTRVWLHKGAVLERPQVFEARLRRVKLTGEAYFEVSHDAARPFQVELPQGGKVEVLGTRFSVRADAGGAVSSVLVREGKVRFSPEGKLRGAVLTANKKAVFDRSTAQTRISTVSTFNELSWQTGGLEFIRTPLHAVITDLERYYGVKIELRNPNLRNCLHTAPLTAQSLEKVLRTLELTYGLEVSIPTPGKYILSGGSCK